MSYNNWKYLPVLNVCLQIMCTILIGAVTGKALPNIFDLNFVGSAVQFVFRVALPCLVIRGVGIGVDFYSDQFLWSYIGSFIVLRAFALVASFALMLVLTKDRSRRSIGKVAVYWLSLSWISTILLGIPIVTAVTEDRQKGRLYGLLASISSFIFQLPMILFFLEYHKNAACHDLVEEEEINKRSEVDSAQIIDENSDNDGVLHNQASAEHEETIRKRVFLHFITNPIVGAILLGFLISLSTLGTKYLQPNDERRIKWLDFLVDALEWFGDCVNPLSLFAMGVWMQKQGTIQFTTVTVDVIISLVSKLILVPCIMLGVTKIFDLHHEVRKAAVLIASLPISMASFSLGKKYQIGETFLAANVTLGTILMLPTVLIWNIILDSYA